MKILLANKISLCENCQKRKSKNILVYRKYISFFTSRLFCGLLCDQCFKKQKAEDEK